MPPLSPVAHLVGTASPDRIGRSQQVQPLRGPADRPATSEEHKRLYGMRQDTERLNAQLERAFYGQRLPAWGVHNQTAVVLFAALAENAWALQVAKG